MTEELVDSYDPSYSSVGFSELSKPVTTNGSNKNREKGIMEKTRSFNLPAAEHGMDEKDENLLFTFQGSETPSDMQDMELDLKDTEVPEYAVIDKARKKNTELSVIHKQFMQNVYDPKLDLTEIEVPTYAVVDKTKKSHTSHSVKESSTFSAAEKKKCISVQDLEDMQEPSLVTQDAEDMYISMLSSDPTPDTKPTKVKSKKIYSHIQRKHVYVAIAVIVITAFTVCLLAAFVEISRLKENKQPSDDDDDVNIEQLISNYLEKHSQNVSNPALPCVYNIYQLAPVTPSNYCIYCDMTRSCDNITGGWMRVTELDMTMDNSHCPAGLTLQNSSTLRTCHIEGDQAGCSSVIYLTNNITYSKVFGKIKAYQYGRTNAFDPFRRGNNTIDDPYVDGVSLTYGQPRQHIWTFAADNNEEGSPPNCPCINSESSDVAKMPQAFVGTDYFCDTGRQNGESLTLLTDDPLWDGAGCGPNNTCCSFNNPPWFYKQLLVPTTEAIEMRVCRDQSRDNEGIAIEAINIYIHP